MNNEKETEELTTTIIEYHCFQHGCDDCGWKHSRGGCEEEPIYRDLARHLIENVGYRKLAADDVVLTKAMQDGSCDGIDDRILEFFKKHNAEVRKETAKEILQAMNEKMNMLTGCGVPYHVKQFMEEIAMQYGVEVDE